jgi:hypothetical protein
MTGPLNANTGNETGFLLLSSLFSRLVDSVFPVSGVRALVFSAYWNYNRREYQFPGYLRALKRLPTSRGSFATDPTTDSIRLCFGEFTVGAHQAGSLLISF